MPARTQETLTSLVDDVNSLRHKVDSSSPQKLSERVEYLEAWLDNHVEEWGKVSSSQDAALRKAETELINMGHVLHLSRQRITALEQELRGNRNMIRSFLNTLDEPVNIVAPFNEPSTP
jgi:hypothetical protein